MANPSKKKGTGGETRVSKFLAEKGIRAPRVPLSGSKDKGDLLMELDDDSRYVIEVKSGKMTDNPSRARLDMWLSQAKVEAENRFGESEGNWFLVVNRYRRKTDDVDVWYENQFGELCHMYLDEFAHIMQMRNKAAIAARTFSESKRDEATKCCAKS